MKEEKKQHIYKTIMLIVLVAMVTFIVTTILISNKIGNTKYIMLSGNDQTSQVNSKIEVFKQLIDEVYMGEVNEEKLNEGILKGYIEGLNDPYSEYYTKEEMEEVKESTLGNFNGIGIVYTIKNTDKKEITVLTVMEDSPAEKAGIMPGDIITKINNEEYSGEELTAVANKLKGEVGTEIKLEILRDGKTLNFALTIQNIKMNQIKTEVLNKNIGYMQITSFDKDTSKEFEEKYKELKRKKINSLIIDLRNNGGGIVEEATSMADMMVEKGKTTLITIDKNGKEETETAKQDPIITEKIVVLVNENTASASEILAGILKDYKKATIVGTTTYGKGVIQELMTLKDGSGLKLTTNEYLTPNRNKINEIGIKPDIEVKLPENVENMYSIEKQKDTQLQKAIEILK